MTWLDLITDAARELRVANAADVLQGDDAAFVLGKANRLLNNWNAERQAVYASLIASFTLVPSTSPHTIGLAADSPTWTVTGNRPEAIEGASLLVNTASYPIHLRSKAWWMAMPTKTLSSAIVTDLYYEPDWPTGKLYFWPVPTSASTVQLLLRTLLASVVIGDTFSLPPGYQDAITLTLAEDCASGFGVDLPPLLPAKAREARARIFAANTMVPKLGNDAPLGRSHRSTWNYLTGRNAS